MTAGTIVYRPYQNVAHAAIRDAVRSGRRRIVLVSPTGSGKTAMLSRVVEGAANKARQVLWVAHRRELVDQAIYALERLRLDVGYGNLRPNALTQVVTVQSVMARGEAPPADIVVLDECHHFVADEWSQLPSTYPSALIIGATATPERGDGRPLNHLFEHMIVAAQPAELVSEGHLVSAETHRPARIQPKGKIARQPWEAYIMVGQRGLPAIVFAPNVKQAIAFADGFREAGITCEVISGELSAETRARRILDFQSGRVTVLINVYVLTEGFDHPPTACVILARHFGSAGQYMQCVGRGLRPSPGKPCCTVIDLTGTTHVHGDALEERLFSLDGVGMKRKAHATISFCRTCGRPSDLCACDDDAKSTVLLESTNDPIMKFAVIRRDTSDERVVRLARWMVEARRMNRKWQSAIYRYKGAYGETPSTTILSAARQRVGV